MLVKLDTKPKELDVVAEMLDGKVEKREQNNFSRHLK